VIQRIALLGVAGAIGTIARYGLTGLVHRIDGASFPWGTAVVNLAGCFLAGFLLVLFEHRWPISGENRTVLLIGFVGSFTTFSTFIVESGQLLESTQWVYAFANIIMHNGLGLIALFAGEMLGRMI
jgi:CrcB protein